MAVNAKYSKWIKIASISLFFLTSILVLTLTYQSVTQNPQGKFTTNVDPIHKTISDLPGDSVNGDSTPVNDLFGQARKWLVKNLNPWRFYQNLANPSSREIFLDSGLRKEEVAAVFGQELKWTPTQKTNFITLDRKLDNKNLEGYYGPGTYIMPVGATPTDAYKAIMNKFNGDVISEYSSSTAEIINMDLALKIASIIEREAAGKADMRIISGVIWNRIFSEMSLDMDATLQYVKGNANNGWWPRVNPEDKFINSPYNTYKNKGLPPTPISNVSLAAINAALNPRKTNCFFYLHDRHGLIHCSTTYAEHLANIKKYYR